MNLVQKAVQYGGKLAPLVIEKILTSGTGLMNPSIFIDDDGEILVNLRHTNYTLYHSENNQKFPSIWGPLSYLHPERDLTLRTTNYLMRLDDNLNVMNSCLVDTSALDIPPVWEFIGQEDCRLVQWDGDYYNIGVRRDTKSNGEGRMELSKIKLDKKNWTAKEVSRIRIPSLGTDESYCEKNWYPIIDKPYHFVKWTSPTEIVRTYPDLPARCEQVSIKETGIPMLTDQRGGSQLIPFDNYYLSITHEVNLFFNYLNQKDGIYRHRLCVWDKEHNLIGVSPEHFSFLDAKIEFAAGAAVHNNDLLISFGFQDNAAFVLRVPNKLVTEMIEEIIQHDNN
jgi:hypothetical protein